jgi:hypothetical protein
MAGAQSMATDHGNIQNPQAIQDQSGRENSAQRSVRVDFEQAGHLAELAEKRLTAQAELRRKHPPLPVREIHTEVQCEILSAEWRVEDERTKAHLRQIVKLNVLASLPTPCDPWELREDFFRVRRGDLKGLLLFLNKYGMWSDDPPGDPEEYWKVRDDLTGILSDRKFFTTKFLPETINVLFKQPYLVSLPWVTQGVKPRAGKRKAMPRFRLNLGCCLDALRLTVDLDLANGYQFGLCPECGVVFRRKTRHRRKYCGLKCAHRASERRTQPKRSEAAKLVRAGRGSSDG